MWPCPLVGWYIFWLVGPSPTSFKVQSSGYKSIVTCNECNAKWRHVIDVIDDIDDVDNVDDVGDMDDVDDDENKRSLLSGTFQIEKKKVPSFFFGIGTLIFFMFGIFYFYFMLNTVDAGTFIFNLLF